MNLLQKDNSNILRGTAILSIMYHNFFHCGLGFSEENEMVYYQSRSNALCLNPTNALYELSSFIGWIGVPVFVFLSGYGLCKKYPPQLPINAHLYFLHNYFKLFFLLLPVIIFFILFDIKDASWTNMFKRIFSLSMLQNINYPQLRTNPEVYWYFSLTFQYYIIYLVFRNFFKPFSLLILSIFSILLLGFLGNSDWYDAMSIYRHCATGWFPVFALGIWFATIDEEISFHCNNLFFEMLILVFLLVCIVVMNLNYFLWLLVPVVSVLLFYYIGVIMIRLPLLSNIFMWLGRYSAFIFVCHPVARTLYLVIQNYLNNIILGTLLYTCMTLFMSYYFEKFYLLIKRKCNYM